MRDIDIRSVASTVDSIRRKPEVDLSIDPPPDLVIEVEITKSAIEKMPLFAAMGIPKVWRHDGQYLQMTFLDGSDYTPTEESRQLPGLTAQMVDRVLQHRFENGETRDSRVPSLASKDGWIMPSGQV